MNEVGGHGIGGDARMPSTWASRVVPPEQAIPDDATDSELLDVLEEYQRQQGRLHALRADAVAVLWQRSRPNSDDIDDVVREVGLIHDLTEPATIRLLTASVRLHEGFAGVRARLEAGALPWSHAELVLVAAGDLDPARFDEFERKALARIEGCSFTQAKHRVRGLVDSMHPEGVTERHRQAVERRHVALEPGADGMGWLHLYLEAAELVAIDDRLTRHAVLVHGDADETRTLGQLRADTARDLLLADTADATDEQMATGARTVGRGVKVVPEVHVTVPVMTLLHEGEEPGHLRNWGPIDPETARRLTADAPSLYRILTHPETGAVLSLGREHYEVTAALRRYLEVRDERCRYPGCNRSANRCDVDHVRPWAQGGPTDHDNLICLCRRDHQDKDRGWTVRLRDDGAVIWTSPYGRVRITWPAIAIGWGIAA